MVLLGVGYDECFVGVISDEVTFSLCNMLHACCGEPVLDALEGKERGPKHGTTGTYNTPVANEILTGAL